jgi:hypothetical protein
MSIKTTIVCDVCLNEIKHEELALCGLYLPEELGTKSLLTLTFGEKKGHICESCEKKLTENLIAAIQEIRDED